MESISSTSIGRNRDTLVNILQQYVNTDYDDDDDNDDDDYEEEQRFRIRDSSLTYSLVGMSSRQISLVSSQRTSIGSSRRTSIVSSFWESSDRLNLIFLTYLYFLQGIPMGLSGSLPYVLQQRDHHSYSNLAIFSFASLPWSLKLLWAPLVDCIYVGRFGKRKSWLVPIQYITALFMLWISFRIDAWLEPGHLNMPIKTMTFAFFILNMLGATQDVVVDGWCLTMLHSKNVKLAATCNSVGYTAGFFAGSIIFMALDSAHFCNNFLRRVPQEYGIVTFSEFMCFNGIVLMLTNTLIMLYVKEPIDAEPPENVLETYQTLWKIISLPSIKKLIPIIITSKICFQATDRLTGLRLIEDGVPPENLGLLNVPLVFWEILIACVAAKHTNCSKPMSLYLQVVPFRLAMGVIMAFIVFWGPSEQSEDGTFSYKFYGVLFLSFLLYQGTRTLCTLCLISFFTKISDPVIGATYMTLVNTLGNLGSTIPHITVLWLIGFLDYETCIEDTKVCYPREEGIEEVCEISKGWCYRTIDGYLVMSFLCLVYGVVWLKTQKGKLTYLENLPAVAWKCR